MREDIAISRLRHDDDDAKTEVRLRRHGEAGA